MGKPVILGRGTGPFSMINCAVSSSMSSSSISMVACGTVSEYGEGRIRNQPSAIGIGVPSARVSKKLEVFPGKIVCAIVEKRKADNPNPATTTPVMVVLYTQKGRVRKTTAATNSGLTILSGKLFMTAFSAAQ